MFLLDGEGWAKVDDSPRPLAQPPRDIAGHRTSVVTLSPDGGTLFAEHPGGKAVWAYRVGADGELSSGEPYCPLRRRIGQEQVAVTGLTTDTAGRIYAATPDGVQVFDPTGRMCGVLTLPAKGAIGRIGWSGTKKHLLALQVGEAWYMRKLNATGTR
jgi:enterochelin esterase family protein